MSCYFRDRILQVCVCSASANSLASLVFLGFAHDKLGQYDSAEQSYRKAISIRPDDVSAYQGLISSYRNQGDAKLVLYDSVVRTLCDRLVQTCVQLISNLVRSAWISSQRTDNPAEVTRTSAETSSRNTSILLEDKGQGQITRMPSS